ncbi:hypothetical protein TBLA_0G01340 [Henningerozyma blattae CBS 6284]|uniref:Phosphatidic acid phosphatase type 2/haloperoxidase domain-containing protein n=1 Tax=Henningerozyma blattae (strain ATCC 34711 / CBS 6284 / DSM 70876 / NBRC 10599 / NRRL Y-10934 / UCD 77-7) TaxID=1071380 RepID=I2H6S8_HENB6|nr:hypothetical protein TBLA_0G01340 [Tetrapisispora blattae CBS 6284]CCH62080.1 hypothetical protein TBLA_0G01340 [Tetrapisispora blattae CBS 6284]
MNNITDLNPNIIPFDDTYILYDPSDLISFLSAYFSLLPILILTFYLSWFISTRELEACIMAAGQLANEIFNNIIKNIIKQPRPISFGDSFQNDTLRSGYGMPSAHSQFMGFLFIYISLKYTLSWKDLSVCKRKLGIVFFALLAFCVCSSRVYLMYHSIDQVFIGFCIGLCTGSSYYLLVGILREIGIINWVLSWWLARRLYIKDSYNLAPLSLREEYDAYLLRLTQYSAGSVDSKKVN